MRAAGRLSQPQPWCPGTLCPPTTRRLPSNIPQSDLRGLLTWAGECLRWPLGDSLRAFVFSSKIYSGIYLEEKKRVKKEEEEEEERKWVPKKRRMKRKRYEIGGGG